MIQFPGDLGKSRNTLLKTYFLFSVCIHLSYDHSLDIIMYLRIQERKVTKHTVIHLYGALG